jgi:uncharacterized protein
MATETKKRSGYSAGLLLTPGAGTSADHPGLVALEKAVRERLPSIDVARLDFPYRLAGRRAPDRAPVLVDAVRAGVTALRSRLPKGAPVVIGGRSMGGRMCSMAVAEGEPVAGLICLCYPLHPPGKADKLRIEHLPRITVPSLFISGTRDSFGTPDELREHLAVVPGRLTLEFLEGAGHDLKKCDDRIAALVTSWLEPLIG